MCASDVAGMQASDLSLERQWLPAEDAQLARGMLRFGQDIGKLRRYFLPVRTEGDIRSRIAQYCSRKIGANPIKVCSLSSYALLISCCMMTAP